MKYILAIIMMLSMISIAYANPGAGLVYGTESMVVSSNREICVPYGLYNPFDVESQITLSAEGEILEFVVSAGSELVPAETKKEDATESEICYKSPDLREDSCIIPFLLCEYSCSVDEKIYSGQVLASPNMPGAVSGSGSAVGMSIAAPFRLIVKCDEEGYNYWPLIFIIITIFALIIAFFVIRYKKKKFKEDEYRRRYAYWQQHQQQQRAQQPQQPVQQRPQQPVQPTQPQTPPQQPYPQPPQNPQNPYNQ